MCTPRRGFQADDEWLGQGLSVRGLKACLNNPELVYRAKLIASIHPAVQYEIKSVACGAVSTGT
jgi:hypothetical protein